MTDKKKNGNGEQAASNGNQQTGIAGFDAGQTSMTEHEAGAVAAVAREEAELKGAIVSARHFPRNEADAFAKLTRSAQRPSFARGARYLFPRGGRDIEGPSVKLAREAARCWGNIRYGVRLVSLDDKFVHVKGWALDLETNAHVEMEDKFERLIFRKKTGWTKPDERDLRELINKRGAICVRNAILQIIPPDIIDEMMVTVRKTIVDAAKDIIKEDKDAAVRTIVVAFDAFGVKTGMIETYLGHNLETITPEELTDLRAVYTAINDGQAKVADYFKNGGRETSEAASELDAAAQETAKMEEFAKASEAQLTVYLKKLADVKTKKALAEWNKAYGATLAEKLLPEHEAQVIEKLKEIEAAL
jgi:hypothetical protein